MHRQSLFKDFIEEFGNEIILLYHCDYHDGKQAKRNNLFKQWYCEAKETFQVYMEDTVITAVDEEGNSIMANYLGFLIVESNPNKLAIQQEFHSVKSDLINEK